MLAYLIDPGNNQSALVPVRVGPMTLAPPWGIVPFVEPESQHQFPRFLPCGDHPNDDAAESLRRMRGTLAGEGAVLVIETMTTIFTGAGRSGRSGATGRDQLETREWAGRFIEASGIPEERIVRVTRSSAAAAVTGTTKVGDSQVRQALIDAYGGQDFAMGKRCKCGGTRKSPCPYGCSDNSGWIHPPGPLAGWTGTHLFAALACGFAAFRPGGVAEHLRFDARREQRREA